MFSELRAHRQAPATRVVCVAVFLTVAASLAPLLGLASPASAATIDVNTTADELNTDGDCALREAVRAANTNSPVDACTAGAVTADTVSVDAGTYTLAIPGGNEDAAQTGDLDLTGGGRVTVAGAGARATTVDGADLDRVFDVRFEATAEISRLAITNGDAPLGSQGGAPVSEPGGGVRNSSRALTLRAVAVTDNTTSGTPPFGPFGFGSGGGVSSGGTTKIFDSVISENRVPPNTPLREVRAPSRPPALTRRSLGHRQSLPLIRSRRLLR